MGGIYGWISNLTTGGTWKIIRRSPEIDIALRKAGYNPEEINCAHTPMVGATEYAKISVLILHAPKSQIPAPLINPNEDFFATQWDMWLQEPGASLSPAGYSGIEAATIPQPGLLPATRSDPPFEGTKPTDGEGGGEGLRPTRIRSKPSMESTNPPLATMEFSMPSQSPPSSDASASLEATMEAMGDRRAISSLTGDEGPDDGSTGPGGQGTPVVALSTTGSRFMHWRNLIPLSITEIRRSANSDKAVQPNGRPRSNDTALFVMEFTDGRYALQTLFGTYSLGYVASNGTPEAQAWFRDKNGQTQVGGPIMGTMFNMLGETPTAFESTSVKLTYLYPPNVKAVGDHIFDNDTNNADTIDASARPVWNIAGSHTVVQVPHSLADILKYFSNRVWGLTRQRVYLSPEIWDISESFAPAAGWLDHGDIVNLDFRGMSCAQALDALAQRIGAVWVWDRSASALILHPVATDPSNYRTPDYADWLNGVEIHRIAGYINTLTLDIPLTVIVSHESVYCAEMGPYENVDAGVAESLDGVPTYAHYVDCRSIKSDDGWVSTAYISGLNTSAPILWHCSSNQPSYLTVDIRDHIPALIGTYFPPGHRINNLPGSPIDYFKPLYLNWGNFMSIGNTSGLQCHSAGFAQYVPWNVDYNTLPMAFTRDPVSGQHDPFSEEFRPPTQGAGESGAERFVTTLKSRRGIMERRMYRLRGVIDGELTLNRMPPNVWGGRLRAHTPSVGLQYETVHFGNDDNNTVRYRLSGKNTHPLLYPAGAQVERKAGGYNLLAHQTHGVPTIKVRHTASNNIKRSFLCYFEADRQISRNPDSADQNNGFIWLYKFVEVVPELNSASLLFTSQDAMGFSRAEGYALNICEVGYWESQPTTAWDGGMLQFNTRDSQGNPTGSVMLTPPRGYAICHEIYNRAGFTSYYVFAPNGVEVTCAPASLISQPTSWQAMGVSGIVRDTNAQGVAGDIIGA